MVVMSHVGLLHYGWMGVHLFFVLSGFLITSILLKEKDKQIPLGIQFRNFWIRRVLRISPLYYLYLFFIIAFWAFHGELGEKAVLLPRLFTYTYNLFSVAADQTMIGHLWTLSIEEQFYLVYPFIILLCSQRQIRAVAIGIILFSIAYRFLYGNYLSSSGIPEHNVGGFIYSSTFSHLDAFLLGGCITIFNTQKITLKQRYIIFLLLLIIMLTAGVLVYLNIRQGYFDFNDYITHLGYTPDFIKLLHHVWSYLLLDLLFASLILILVSPVNSFLSRCFRFTPLASMGKISYGMYILHACVLYFITPLLHQYNIYNKYIVFLICLPLIYGLAFIVYQLYEKKFLVLKERFR